MKSSHSIAAISTFLFISSKQIPSLVFIGSGGASYCFDEDVHPFIYSFIISTRLLLLHLLDLTSSSSLLLPFTASIIISNRVLLLYLHIPISSSFLSASFHCLIYNIISTFSLTLIFPIPYSSLLLALLQCGISASELKFEVLLVDRLVRFLLFTKQAFFGEGLDVLYFLFFLVFFSLFIF